MPTNEILVPVVLVAGAAGLMLCLLMFIRYRRQQHHIAGLMRHIEALKSEKQGLAARLRSTVQPNFEVVNVSINEQVKRIDIKVQNQGHAATLEKVVTNTPDIEFLDDRFYPQHIESQEYFIFTGLSKELPLSECRYVVQMHYSDAQGNTYLTQIRGEGKDCQIKTAYNSAY